MKMMRNSTRSGIRENADLDDTELRTNPYTS
jgi:hypothetical protein